MSRMPKNCWKEIDFLSDKQVKIYFAKKITSGKGSNILGLTSDANSVWFATFGPEIRGVLYSGYFNIMIHEFVHVFHYNFTSAPKNEFQSALQKLNLGYAYKSGAGAEGVYGVSSEYDATNSCFLSAYSRTNAMEDTAETISLITTITTYRDFLDRSANIRQKYDLLLSAFSQEFETLALFKNPNLFGYPHLFSEAI